MQNSFRLGRIAGIEIGLHYSWLLAFGLISWSLAAGFFPAMYPGWGATAYWLVGSLSALLLFASVLVHELGHALVAKAFGQGVQGITLFLFGGVATLKGEPAEARQEFLIAIVGPLTSFAVAAVFWLAAQGLGADASPLGAALAYLAYVNVMLAVFNLLPGFPLDGGRVLRALIWGATGSLRRATQIATYVGQGFAFLLIFGGVAQVLAGNFLGGLWIAFIGWFLNNAAETTRQQQALQESLAGVRVSEVMNPTPPVAPPQLSVHDFVFEHVVRQGRRALLVLEDGRLQGIVSITDARKLPQAEWEGTPIGAIMTPAPLKTISPDTDLVQALQMLVEGTLNQLPVVENGRLVGLLSRADILRYLQLRRELDLRSGAGRRGGTETGAPRPAT